MGRGYFQWIGPESDGYLDRMNVSGLEDERVSKEEVSTTETGATGEEEETISTTVYPGGDGGGPHSDRIRGRNVPRCGGAGTVPIVFTMYFHPFFKKDIK